MIICDDCGFRVERANIYNIPGSRGYKVDLQICPDCEEMILAFLGETNSYPSIDAYLEEGLSLGIYSHKRGNCDSRCLTDH